MTAMTPIPAALSWQAPELTATRHADARIRQRGFRERDLEALVRFGREMPDGTVRLLDEDVEREIDGLRRWIAMLDRLRGMTAVIDGGRVVTVYKSRRQKRRPRREG